MNSFSPNIVILTALSRLGATGMNVPSGIDEPTEEQYNTLIHADKKPTWAEFQAEFTAAKLRRGDRLLRDFRSLVLTSTDWIMTGDHMELLENKADWLAFRQAFRDLPDSNITYAFIPGMQKLDISKMTFPPVPPLIRTGMTTKYFAIGFFGQLIPIQPPTTT